MKIDDNFYIRVAATRKSLGLTQDQLAEKVGVVRRQIAAYEAGDSKPRENVLSNLAHILGATTEWLATGDGDGPDISNVRKTITVRELPIITLASVSSYNPEDAESKMSVVGYMPAPHEAGEYSFAVQVFGDSMTSVSGPSFPDGTIVVVDPDLTVGHGDFGIFSSIYTNEATFKQLIVDQTQEFLRPLNTLYPIIEKNSDFITYGKVVAAQLPLDASSSARSTPKEQPGDFELGLAGIESLHSRLSALEEKIDYLISISSDANKKPT